MWIAMSTLNIRATCKTAVASSLVLALLVRVALADGLLLHDHSDHGVHAHAVTLDDLCEGDLRPTWHHAHDDMHDDDRDDRNNDSDGGESRRAGTDSLVVFLNSPANASSIHCWSGAVIASIHQLSSTVLPRSVPSSHTPDASRFLTAPMPSAHPLRPASALDALLQSSHALLL